MIANFPLQINQPTVDPAVSAEGRCRGGELDPPTRPWVIQGVLFGSGISLAATPKVSPLHFLIPEQNAMAVAALVFWGMAGAFMLAKWRLLRREQQAGSNPELEALVVTPGSDVDGLINLAERSGSLKGKRLTDLLRIWKDTAAPFQLERALDTHKELYEHSIQSSYLLARVLVWAIPIFGFVGTVGGISHAVGAFDKVLNSAENVEALRAGLIQVTGGLSKAFHTTSLGLVLSVIVMLPLTYLEKMEQEMLGSMDIELRTKLLMLTPPDGFSDVEEASISRLIADSFERHLPDPSVLVEPAKVYAEKLSEGTLARLDPLRTFTRESIEGLAEARLSIQDQTHEIKRELDGLGAELLRSIGSVAPLMKSLIQLTERASRDRDDLAVQADLQDLKASMERLEALMAANVEPGSQGLDQPPPRRQGPRAWLQSLLVGDED